MNIQDISRPFKAGDFTEEELRLELAMMENDPGLDTPPIMTKINDSPECLVTFQERHLQYLLAHPKINPAPYLANLKTMIKIRH